MLVQFSVANFKSFKNRATLSLEATTDDWRDYDNVAASNVFKRRLVKSAAIYGPNAGGKSNFIQAMTLFRQLVLSSSKDSQTGESIPVVSFRLNTATVKKPTLFEVLFIVDNVRYRYGFEATKQSIVSEWLYEQASSIRPKCLFTRESEKISVRDGFREGRGLEERTRRNALFLSVAAQFNGKIAGRIMEWMQRFRSITGLNDIGYVAFTTKLLSDPLYGSPIRELMRLADVGIQDLVREDIDKTELQKRLEKERTDLPRPVLDLILQEAESASIVRARHYLFDSKNRRTGEVEFDLRTEESAGTNQFFALAGPFLHTLHDGAVLIVDEFDARLHPLLTKQLLALFNSSANRRNAQLVFATHDQGLLDQKRIRRDQVWFIEKDQFGSSSLFSLDEIKGVRKDANFEKEYLLGQFGGVPHFGDLQKAADHVEK